MWKNMVKIDRPQIMVCRFIHNSHNISQNCTLESQKDCNLWTTDGKRNSSRFCSVPLQWCTCPLFVKWQTSSRWSISAHTHCSMSRLISEIATMVCLCRWGRSNGRGGRKTLTYPIRQNSMVLGQAILVASETVPGLLQWVWVEMDYQFDICHVTKEDT